MQSSRGTKAFIAIEKLVTRQLRSKNFRENHSADFFNSYAAELSGDQYQSLFEKYFVGGPVTKRLPGAVV
jgi:hypothetical protein